MNLHGLPNFMVAMNNPPAGINAGQAHSAIGAMELATLQIRLAASCEMTIETTGSEMDISIIRNDGEPRNVTSDLPRPDHPQTGTAANGVGLTLELIARVGHTNTPLRFARKKSKTMNWPNNACNPIWEHADWLPPHYILDHWCQQDARCRYAKQQALFSACERGDIYYRRSDGKTFDDPIHELSARGILLIDRDSFVAWVTTVEGQSPLPARARKQPPYPGWASPGDYQFDEEQWNWVPVTTPVSAPAVPPAPPASTSTGTAPAHAGPPPAWVQAMRAAQAESAAVSAEASQADAVAQPVAEEADKMSVEGSYPPEEELRKRGVPADEIIDAFRVDGDLYRNRKWWKERLSNPSRYKKIESALVQKGRRSRGRQYFPSWWNPFLVASWLVSEGHMSRERVVRALESKFPDFAQHIDYM